MPDTYEFRFDRKGPFPVKPGDWVADSSKRVAKVKDVYSEAGEVLVDLIIYDRKGTRVGRETPALGGPRTFEPACSFEGWSRIDRPVFPITLKWGPPGEDGFRSASYDVGPRLPARQWVRPERKLRARPLPPRPQSPDEWLIRALEAIRDGHNDPRALAREVLDLVSPAAPEVELEAGDEPGMPRF